MKVVFNIKKEGDTTILSFPIENGDTISIYLPKEGDVIVKEEKMGISFTMPRDSTFTELIERLNYEMSAKEEVSESF